MMKAICPECKKEVNYLHCYRELKFIFEVKMGRPVYKKYQDEHESWECPECCAVLFDEDDITGAIRFLRGDAK